MRRAGDFYETPPWMTRALLANVPEIGGRVLECCAGNGSIAAVLASEGGLAVVTNDVDAEKPADYHLDAALPALWSAVGPIDWVISNTPYVGHLCLPIVRLALERARVGVALMLRLSFLEPTPQGLRARRTKAGHVIPASEPRGPWLAEHPIDRLLVMPRHSFTGRGTDSVTTAWMVWARVPLSGRPHVSCHLAERVYAQPWSRMVA